MDANTLSQKPLLAIYGWSRLRPAREFPFKRPVGSWASATKTYYHWKQEYRGLRVDQANRLKNLEQENARLQELVDDLSRDKAILDEVAEGNVSAQHDDERRWCQCNRI